MPACCMVSADRSRVCLNVSVEGHRNKRRSYVRDVHLMASPSLCCHFVWGLVDQSLRRAEARQVVSRQVRGSLTALSSPNQSGVTEEMTSRLCHESSIEEASLYLCPMIFMKTCRHYGVGLPKVHVPAEFVQPALGTECYTSVTEALVPSSPPGVQNGSFLAFTGLPSPKGPFTQSHSQRTQTVDELGHQENPLQRDFR